MFEVKATRSELLNLKRRIKIAETGHRLLSMKRDGLILEFFNVLEKAKEMRRKIIEDYRIAERKIALAEAVDGSLAVRSAAFTRKETPMIEMEYRNVMGVLVPVVRGKGVRKRLMERGYGIIGTSARIDEAVSAFENLIEDIMRAAEVETTLRRILEEIEKTKRRVNALEYRIIPTLKGMASFIAFRLEEMDRESIFRLKRIKAKTEA